MTKKQELQVLELIIKDGEVKAGSYDGFWEEYRSQFTFTWNELVPILNKYYHAGDFDENLVVTAQLTPKYEALKKEVETENARQIMADDHLGNKAKLVARQKKFFWVPIVISFAALIVAVFKPSPKYDDQELKEYIKTYMDSTETVIRNEIDSSKVNVFDTIYNDTNIVN